MPARAKGAAVAGGDVAGQFTGAQRRRSRGGWTGQAQVFAPGVEGTGALFSRAALFRVAAISVVLTLVKLFNGIASILIPWREKLSHGNLPWQSSALPGIHFARDYIREQVPSDPL